MRIDRIGAGLLLFLGGFIVYEALRLPYTSISGPGPGFFPFWIGLMMMILSVLLFVTTRRPDRPFFEPDARFKRVATVAGSFLAFVLVLNYLGLLLTGVLFSAFAVGVVEKRGWRAWLPASVLIGAGCYLVFSYWLHVPFPKGILGL